MVRKFGEFGESSAFCQTKSFKLAVTINKPLPDLFIIAKLFPPKA